MKTNNKASMRHGALDFTNMGRSSCTGLSCKLHRPRFADHGHLDFSGIIELLLDGLGNLAASLDRFAVGKLMSVGDHAQLAAGLDGEGVLDAGEAAGNS